MKFKVAFLILLLLFAFSIEARNGIKFTELKTNSNIQPQVINSINDSLITRGYIPEEFFVEVTEDDETYIFVLIHQDTYLPKNDLVLGNASGKDHECRYHKLDQEIVSCLHYQ